MRNSVKQLAQQLVEYLVIATYTQYLFTNITQQIKYTLVNYYNGHLTAVNKTEMQINGG